jgi:hypothetical protein
LFSSDYPQFVNSKVISASLGKPGRHVELPEPVSVTFKHLRTINVSSPECVYWDYLSNEWSKDGCRVVESNRTHTRCLCSHLTNFALLMREGGLEGGRGDFPETNAVPLLKSTKTANLGAHVSTIVAAVAALISICVIVFFLVMAWRRMKVRLSILFNNLCNVNVTNNLLFSDVKPVSRHPGKVQPPLLPQEQGSGGQRRR